MLYTSSYYEQSFEFSEDQIEMLLEIYGKWCELNNLKPEVEDVDSFKDDEVIRNHVLYHVELMKNNELYSDEVKKILLDQIQ